ncbi:MAG: hypothetical protein AB7S41_11425 [Parvibaculaceae bacterium]
MRQPAANATALLLVLLLAACSGQGPQPFSKSGRAEGHKPPAIAVGTMAGLPPDRENLLLSTLSAAAAKRDIVVVKGPAPGAYRLTGEFVAEPRPDGTVLAYRWMLSDEKGTLMSEIAEEEIGRPVAGDPWQGIDPDTLRRVANYTAESLSSRLLQLGYATQSAGLLPPTDTFVEAGPNAEKDIDPDLYGRRAAAIMMPESLAAPPEMQARQAPGTFAQTADPQHTATLPPAANDAARTQAAVEEPAMAPSRTGKADKEIGAVAVTSVRGSPGRGNQELAGAMRKVLGKAGWPVLTAARSDALSIEAVVKLGKAEGKMQNVELRWVVKMPDGRVLGEVKQANRVEVGSLDKGWGEAANFAAQGAAHGIFELVAKARKTL